MDPGDDGTEFRVRLSKVGLALFGKDILSVRCLVDDERKLPSVRISMDDINERLPPEDSDLSSGIELRSRYRL